MLICVPKKKKKKRRKRHCADESYKQIPSHRRLCPLGLYTIYACNTLMPTQLQLATERRGYDSIESRIYVRHTSEPGYQRPSEQYANTMLYT